MTGTQPLARSILLCLPGLSTNPAIGQSSLCPASGLGGQEPVVAAGPGVPTSRGRCLPWLLGPHIPSTQEPGPCAPLAGSDGGPVLPSWPPPSQAPARPMTTLLGVPSPTPAFLCMTLLGPHPPGPLQPYATPARPPWPPCPQVTPPRAAADSTQANRTPPRCIPAPRSPCHGMPWVPLCWGLPHPFLPRTKPSPPWGPTGRGTEGEVA